MSTAANIVILVVALLHVYFLVLEMFLWDKPMGLRAFGQTLEAATASKNRWPRPDPSHRGEAPRPRRPRRRRIEDLGGLARLL